MYLSLPPQLVAECGTLSDPTNGNVSTSSGTNEGATATYSCDTGYNFNGSMTRTCGDDGNWTLSEPTCDRKLCLARLCVLYMSSVVLVHVCYITAVGIELSVCLYQLYSC